MSVRVLILHEQRLFREGLRAVLHGRGGLDVVGDTADSATALLLIGETSPDVMVFDLWNLARLPRAHGTPLVALGEDGDRPQVARALQAGVAALVTKSDSPEELAAAIRAAAAGQIYVTPRLCVPGAPLVLHAAPTPGDPLRALTSREREIFTLVISGLSTAAIARRLDLSPRTVETHRGHLSHKLGARSAADLVRFAARSGLLPS
jgi:two-component system, NarL family, response regulator NreC